MSDDRREPVARASFESHSARSLCAYVLATAIVLGSYLWVRSGLGLGHPIPWPDEGSFLWQALAVEQHGTLFAPQLNPDRHLLWMPPGYMVIQGLVFKLTGFSLTWARTLSALYMAGGAALLAATFWRLRHPFVNLALLAVFLHSPIALLVGNVARMESLVLLLAAAGLLCLQRERQLVGLALILLLPLIHPNGFFFYIGGGGYALVSYLRTNPRPRPTWGGLASVGGALLLWLLYLLYAVLHFDSFATDMEFQFAAKGVMGSGARIAIPRVAIPGLAIPLGMLLFAGSLAFSRRLPSALLCIYAAPLLLLSAVSPGWLYELYLALASLLVGVAFVEAVASLLPKAPFRWKLSVRGAVASGLGLVVLCGGLVASRHDRLLSASVSRATVPRPGSARPAYFTPADERRIRAYLESASAVEPISVLFFPWSEALLFHDLESDRLEFVQPTFYAHRADMVILHQSQHVPRWVRQSFRARAKSQGIERPFAAWPVIRKRDGSEQWRVYVRKKSESGR